MPLSQADFEYIRNLVHQRAAIVLESEKAYRVENALATLARQEGCASVDELVGRMRTMAVNGLHQKAVEAMTINETSFFRDLYPFESLRRVIVPEILQRRATERRLDIWCAACSTGQEPYSVAMLCREHFPILSGWNVRIVASDLSGAALDKARSGKYTQLEVNRGLSAMMMIKYFQRQGLVWQLKEDVRRLIDFRPINLIESWPIVGPLDVVFLRNVLIYFDVETKKRILERIRSLLRPGGVLFLGGAETTLQLSTAYDRVVLDKHAFYQAREK